MKTFLAIAVMIITSVNAAGVQSQQKHKGHQCPHAAGTAKGIHIVKAERQGLTVNGYLNDIKKSMREMAKKSGMTIDESKMNPDITHHISFFVTGTDKTGDIKKATLKISRSKQENTYTLMMMKDHYGSDVSLKSTGSYRAQLILETARRGTVTFDFNFSI